MADVSGGRPVPGAAYLNLSFPSPQPLPLFLWIGASRAWPVNSSTCLHVLRALQNKREFLRREALTNASISSGIESTKAWTKSGRDSSLGTFLGGCSKDSITDITRIQIPF